MKLYKLFSLASIGIFAVVGFIFLFFPDAALIFFNFISRHFGLPQSPVTGISFYLALASAYMYFVTVLAYKMYRNPQQKIYPYLLAHAKLGSAIFSIYLFITHGHYLIYFANFVIDGFIGICAIYFYRKMRSTLCY